MAGVTGSSTLSWPAVEGQLNARFRLGAVGFIGAGEPSHRGIRLHRAPTEVLKNRIKVIRVLRGFSNEEVVLRSAPGGPHWVRTQ